MASGWLLDTNVVSELVRVAPDTLVTGWVSRRSASVHVSTITVGEIERGVRRLPSGAKRRRLQRWVEVELPAFFAERLLPFDLAAAVEWGEIMAQADRAGRQRPALDAQIAATARRHDLVVATRDRRGFLGIDVQVVDPWTDRT